MGVNGIYGLSGSGLDIESMVKMGMMSKENQYAKMQQTYTQNEWKKEAYLKFYDQIQEYSTSTLSNFKLTGYMNAREAKSNNSAITATADSSAPVMSHTISVKNIATNAYLLGTESLNSTTLNKISYTVVTDSDTGATDTAKLFTTGDKKLEFVIGADSDSGLTQTPEYASASYSNTELSSASKAKNLLKNAILNTHNTSPPMISLSDITTYDDKVYFSGLNSNGVATSTYVSSTDSALSFTMKDGIKTSGPDISVNITYGDLATLLSDDDATFQDFVDLLNKRIDNNKLNITASYDEYDGFTFTNKIAGNSVEVSLGYGDPGLNDYVIEALGEGTDTGIVTSDTGKAASTDTKLKPVNLEVNENTTVYTLINAIKNQAGTNIRATYDASDKTFSIYNTKTGSSNGIAIKALNEDTAKLFNLMGLIDTSSSSTTPLEFKNSETTVVSGKDATVVIDGNEIKESSNTFSRKGVNYDISNVTSKTSATVTVSQDVETIVKNVKSFVESYNTLLNDLYTAYRETPNSSYKPLTEAQKSEMTEEQIKKWEEKAKAGMLYHDNTIRKIIDNMRSAVSDSVTSLSGNYTNAYSLGIGTEGLYGQLKLDEEKLRAALADDPDSVYNVFAKLNDSANLSSSENGFAQRLGAVTNNAVLSIKSVAGTSTDTSDDSSLSVLMRSLQTRMSNFKAMMDAFESNLYKKYDAMESALASLGSQLNYVTGMFS